MASAMATAAARNISHPYTIPVGPRIRPPRLLPGTKAANTDPQPDEPPPNAGDVWVQGKWRNPSSNAARDRREVQSTKAEKSLRHVTHGMNIYAYSHMRTNQVVYSLTRVMQNNKILPQLLNHGKQTVPSSIRRDVWRPYFSIHFPETPAGAQAGLKAYHRLRELSVKRQLSPPPELVIATEEDVQRIKDKYTPLEFRTKIKSHKVKNMPIKNQLLPKKLRARRLMDQKASSVADAAFVLGFINRELSPAEQHDAVTEARASKYQQLSSRAARRLNKIREQETVKDAQIEARQETIQPQEGQLGLTPHTARRIALEHGGAVAAPWKGFEYAVKEPEAITRQKAATNEYLQSTTTLDALLSGEQRPTEFNADKFRSRYVKSWREQNEHAEGPATELVEAAVKEEQEQVEVQIADYDRRAAEVKATFAEGQQDRNSTSRTVQVFWADLRDATWAENWSSNVYHGELEHRAALKHERNLIRQKATIDQEGNEVRGGHKKILVQGATTPHVFGTSNQTGWYETPSQLSEKRQQWREGQLAQWRESKLEKSKEILKQIDALYKKRKELLEEKLERQPEYDALKRFQNKLDLSQSLQLTESSSMDNAIQNLTDAEKYELETSAVAVEDSIAEVEGQISDIETNHPSMAEKVNDLIAWRQGQTTYMDLSRIRDELLKLEANHALEEPATSQRLQELDLQIAAHGEEYPELGQMHSAEADLIDRTYANNDKMAALKQELADLEVAEKTPSTEREILAVEKQIQFTQLAIRSDHRDVYESRVNELEKVTLALENQYDRDIIDDLRQRVHAEQQNNMEQMEALDQKIQAREQDKLAELLDLDISKPVEAQVTELDDEAREKGQEMPPPPSKGVWGRVKSMFGR